VLSSVARLFLFHAAQATAARFFFATGERESAATNTNSYMIAARMPDRIQTVKRNTREE
jgi:HAMP domain-containing protein